MELTVMETPKLHMGRRVLFSALTGSYSYNLNTPESDRDYHMFVLPNIDDMYSGRIMSKQSFGLDRDLTVYDARRIPELLWRSNPTFIDILYSREIVRRDDVCRLEERSEAVGKFLDGLFSMRADLARMNLPYFWDATMGIFHNKTRNYLVGTVNTRHLVEKYGYDPKMVMHGIRILTIVERFAESGFEDYGGAIWYDGDDRDRMMRIRNGEYSVQEAKAMMSSKLEEVQRYKDLYRSKHPDYLTKERAEGLMRRTVAVSLLDEIEEKRIGNRSEG